MKRIAVLVSGRGSNLQALDRRAGRGALGGDIVVVVSNVARGARPRASEPRRHRNSPCSTTEAARREDFDREPRRAPRRSGVSTSCVSPASCGSSRLSSSAHSPGRILNIHPSLLPAFAGQNAQPQALAHGVKLSGATVHLVDEGLDSAPSSSRKP